MYTLMQSLSWQRLAFLATWFVIDMAIQLVLRRRGGG